MTISRESIGKNIRELRHIRGYTLAFVANAMSTLSKEDISEDMIGAWERGTRNINAVQLHYLAMVLSCSVNVLYGYPIIESENQTEMHRRLFHELNLLSKEEIEILHYAVTHWSGNPHALIQFAGLYMSLPKEYRLDISGMGIHQYEKAVEEGVLDKNAPPVDLEHIIEAWNNLVSKKRKGYI